MHMYDFTRDEWTELPSMLEGRRSHGCGLVTKSDGTVEVVVAGGVSNEQGIRINSVEIYSFNNQEWR